VLAARLDRDEVLQRVEQRRLLARREGLDLLDWRGAGAGREHGAGNGKKSEPEFRDHRGNSARTVGKSARAQRIRVGNRGKGDFAHADAGGAVAHPYAAAAFAAFCSTKS